MSEIEWSRIFAEAERITGKPLGNDTQELWKRNGKPWALDTIQILAKINEKPTAMPYYPRRRQ